MLASRCTQLQPWMTTAVFPRTALCLALREAPLKTGGSTNVRLALRLAPSNPVGKSAQHSTAPHAAPPHFASQALRLAPFKSDGIATPDLALR